jgi:phage gp29-like protein
MGNTQTGSFALGAIKNSLTATTVESYLSGIIRVFNEDLIKHLYILNGWDVTRRCTLDSEGFAEIDLDSYSKAINRIGATGYLPRTLDVINDVMSKMGLDALPDGTNLDDVLPDKTTKSGEGYKTTGAGTSKETSGSSGSELNSENAA